MKFGILPIAFILLQTAYAQCDYDIEIQLEGSNFSNSDFSFKISSERIEGIKTNISSTIRIEKDGIPIKEYYPWDNDPITTKKTSTSYSPNLDLGEYMIYSEITVSCLDTNLDNNKDQKRFSITTGLDSKTTNLAVETQSFNQVQQFDESKIIYLSKEDIESAKAEPRTYRSSGEKTKDIGILLALFASIILNLVLILKKS